MKKFILTITTILLILCSCNSGIKEATYEVKLKNGEIVHVKGYTSEMWKRTGECIIHAIDGDSTFPYDEVLYIVRLEDKDETVHR